MDNEPSGSQGGGLEPAGPLNPFPTGGGGGDDRSDCVERDRAVCGCGHPSTWSFSFSANWRAEWAAWLGGTLRGAALGAAPWHGDSYYGTGSAWRTWSAP